MGELVHVASGTAMLLGQISDRPMSQADVYRMIGQRRGGGRAHENRPPYLPCHRHHGILEKRWQARGPQQMANHESARTGLYDRRNDQVLLDEVEWIVI